MQIRCFRSILKCAFLLTLVGYIWFILDSTLFGRTDSPEYQYKTIPFWSYFAILDGETNLVKEDILNVALFVPIGLLLYCIVAVRKWWIALVFGFGLSSCIELLQLVWKRGTCEFDDVFHNTIGCLIGYFIARIIIKCCRSNL